MFRSDETNINPHIRAKAGIQGDMPGPDSRFRRNERNVV
jgi:hypothetical protein